MTPGERVHYFVTLWPAACSVKRWNHRDEAKRRTVTAECMRLVRGPQTNSTTALGRDEVTALFCYLDFLAHPADLVRSARWADCQTDYHAYNRARQADWHESKAYGEGGSKRLRKQRFAGSNTAQGEPLEPFDPAAIRKRHLTMATRHQAKQRKERAAERPGVIVIPPQDADGEIDHRRPDPEYVPPVDRPF